MSRFLSIVVIVFVFAGCKTATSPSDNTPLPSTARERISGTVKDASTDAPLAGAFVTLSKPDSLSTTSDATGYFKFDSVTPGVYTVYATAAGYSRDQTTIRLDSGVNVSVTLRPQKNAATGTGTLDVHVTDSATGLPIDTALVGFMVTQDSASKVTETNASGVFDTTLAVGSYLMGVTADGYEVIYFTCTIQQGQTLTQNIRLGKYVAPPPVSDTLLALYRFSGSVLDSSGYGRNATKHGGTYVADRFGNPASALQFNGTSDYLSVPDSPDLNFGKSGNFTICFWVFNASTSSRGFVVRKGTLANNLLTGYEVDASQYISAAIGTTYGNASTNGFMSYIPSDSRWHFVVVTFDRIFGVNINIDLPGGGDQISGGTYALQGNINTAAQLLIGGDGTTAHAYKGVLDDVRIYKGILGYNEITTLYHENGW